MINYKMKLYANYFFVGFFFIGAKKITQFLPPINGNLYTNRLKK